MLIYIHGFNSSALSFKAGVVRDRMATLGRIGEFACPELAHRPEAAVAQLEKLMAGAGKSPVALIGSSLGGFYATWLAEKHGGRYLVRGPVTAQLEGEAVPGERIVVLEFPDEAAARGYVQSPEYQAGKVHREGAGTVNLRLVAA